MNFFANYTSPGYTVGIIALTILMLIGLGSFLVGALIGIDGKNQMRRRKVRQGALISLWSVLWVVVVFGVWLWASWPLKYDYHHYVEKTGVVQKVGNRLISGGEGIVNQRFVFIINGSPYGVDDTRASVAQVGDTVKLFCKKEHQFGQQYANDGWACRWGGVTS